MTKTKPYRTEAAKPKTVQELASALADAFVTDKRNDGKEFVHLKTNSPQWMTDAVHKAHGNTMPDDTIYEFCQRAAFAIADAEEPEEAINEMEPDPYTHDLTAWLHARADHVYFLTEALEEGSGITDGFQLLARAQQIQIHEIARILLAALEELAEADGYEN